ncbi:MAG: hypothetical protein IPM17_08985 [Verrucomicrobia bacterium]|nr:hypothetical protein [Verrucomicrobiota bacterium]
MFTLKSVWTSLRGLRSFVPTLFTLAAVTGGLAQTAGDRVNLAAFGAPLPAPDCGVEWTGPIRVDEVRVTPPPGEDPAGWRLEWWGSIWPDHGEGGWKRLDDPWNGEWVRVNVTPEPEGSGAWIFRFPALDRTEWRKAIEARRYPDGVAPAWRKTLKIRLLDARERPAPAQTMLEAFSDACWATAGFDLWHRLATDAPATFRLEPRHGEVLTLRPLSDGVKIAGPLWTVRGPAGASRGVRAQLRFVESADPDGEERTRVTVRLGGEEDATGFSFVPQDVPTREAMRLPDFAFLIARAELGRTWDNDPGPPPEAWRKRVRLRLTERPEATRETAEAGIPRLSPPKDVPLGVPSARQEFFVAPHGDWAIYAQSLHTDNGRDARRWVFAQQFGNDRPAGELRATLDTRLAPHFDGRDREAAERWLEAGHLPLIHVRWHTGPIQFHHELATTVLEGDYGNDAARRGDETVVLLSRLWLTNSAAAPQTVAVNLRYNLDWPLRLDEDGLIRVEWPAERARPPGSELVRGQVRETSWSSPPGTWRVLPATAKGTSPILRWEANLQPGEHRVLEFKSPFIEALDPGELERLRTITFAEAVPAMLGYWRERLAHRTQIVTPDPALNDFYRANLWHILITTDRDPETGLFNQGVGTVRYQVFANETVMIARYLDRVGEHLEARRFLEPLLHYQGHEPLTGRFSTQAGVFHSAGAYTHGQYAMNHGFVLWGAADHYLITRDREWLWRVAPQLIRGCDFLIRERRATFGPAGEARSPIHGLAPASSLEDVIEFQYWFAVNAYFHLGLKRVAEALADWDAGEAARLAREAEAYRRDIERAAREAAARAAVVRLRDQAWIPYVPSRVFQWRHLTEGWIREALYPALHLAAGEVVRPQDPLMTWMLDDLEDNLFFSWQSGLNVRDFEQTWFERGGVTLQPCLLDLLPTYLARDEIPAALRNFWNTWALSIYPDTVCFTEWVRRFGEGGGPLYKTSDEARFLLWLRELILWENGDLVWYGRGVPRAWLADGRETVLSGAPTWFGPTTFRVKSELCNGRIRAQLILPARELPREVWLRLRHPEGRAPASVTLNGKPLPTATRRGEDIAVPLEALAPGQVLELEARYAH